MKKLIALLFLFVFTTTISAQDRGLDSWSIGAGVSNFVMQGDLRSYGQLDVLDNFNFNLGYHLYVDKMITPAFGFELKGRYTNISGGAFELTDYDVLYTSVPLNLTRFEGVAYGAEFNTILNFSSLARKPYSTKERKWNVASYFGLGMHYYDSKLYNITNDNLLVDFGDSPSSNHSTNSLYYTAGMGFKYKVNNNIDIELRQDINVNEDDYLDAAGSMKAPLDVFYNTSLGVVFKLNKKNYNNYTWLDELTETEGIEEENPLVDSDGDGVIDMFDKEPNTPRGAFVYGNGVTIDTDKDGIPDHIDKCPTRYSRGNNGCPVDTDGDGITDDIDLCPKVAGDKANLGCPKDAFESTTDTNIIAVEPVFFDLNLSNIKKEYNDMLSKAALTLLQNPEVLITLEGHADVRGDANYNQQLSESRVESVKNALMQRGIDASRIISTTGYGENNPTFVNKNYHGYNRRVDIIFSN